MNAYETNDIVDFFSYVVNEKNFGAFILIFIRLNVIINLSPFLGSQACSSLFKIALSVFFSCYFFIFIPCETIHIFSYKFALLACKELLVGFSLGFVAAQILYVADIAGKLIDISRATSQVELLVPTLKERSSAVGSLLVQLTLTLFFISGLHAMFFTTLSESFRLIPIDMFAFGYAQIHGVAEECVQLLVTIYSLGLKLAAPVVITCFVVDISLGLINRIAGQIDAYFMSMPAKSLSGMLIFYCALSISPEQCLSYAAIVSSKLWNILMYLQVH